MHHTARGLLKARLADVVARFFLADHGVDVGDELRVGVAYAHAPGKVVIEDGEEAGADLAVGGDAPPTAMSTEGVRDRRDDADLAHAIVELEPPCRLATLMFD